jgi:hypothetical protein
MTTQLLKFDVGVLLAQTRDWLAVPNQKDPPLADIPNGIRSKNVCMMHLPLLDIQVLTGSLSKSVTSRSTSLSTSSNLSVETHYRDIGACADIRRTIVAY